MAALSAAEGEREEGAKPPGSLGALIKAYRASDKFRSKAPRTRESYQAVFDFVAKGDSVALASITQPHAYRLRDLAYQKHGRVFANNLIAVMRLLWNWGLRRGLVKSNPFEKMDKVDRPRDARVINRRWTDAELATVLAPDVLGPDKAAPFELQLAIALGAYLGLRESDVIAATWAAYDGRDFRIRQQKTGVEVRLPVHKQLRFFLDAARKARSPDPRTHIVVGARGGPFTRGGFQARFFKFLRELRKVGKVGEGLSFHGLRHTVGNTLAENGCCASAWPICSGSPPTRTTATRTDLPKSTNRGRGSHPTGVEPAL